MLERPMIRAMMTNTLLYLSLTGHNIPTGKTAFMNIITFMLLIVDITWIILFFVGLIKLMLAFSEEDGAAFQKAVLILGSAVAVFVIRIVLVKVFGIRNIIQSLPEFPMAK